LPGATVTLTGSATSQTGTTLTYAWAVRSPATLPQGTTLTVVTARTAGFSATAAGVYTIELTVSDGSGSSSRASVSVIVNTPPTVSAGADRTVVPASAVTLTATASDADSGDALAYAWTQTSGPSVSISTPASSAITVGPLSEGSYAFAVTVTDSRAASASASVRVTATSPRPNLVAVSAGAAAGTASVAVNDVLAVTGIVRNSGQAASPACQAAFLLSSSPTLSAVPPLLGTTGLPALSAGITATVSGRFVVSASIGPGTYFVALAADSAGTVAESDETDNNAVSPSSLSVTPPVARVPNLVARFVSFSNTAAALRAGDAFTAAARVENGGTLDVTSSFGLTFFLSTDASLGAGDPTAGNDTVPLLAAGTGADRFPSLAVPPALAPGRYFLLLSVDPAGAIVESSRSDNVIASQAPADIASRPVDSTPPTAVLTFVPGQNLTAAGPLTIRATFSERLAQLPQLQISSGAGRLIIGVMSGDLSGTFFELTQGFTSADNGTYTVALRAADLAGNALAAQPANASFSIAIQKNRPPVVSAGPSLVVSVGTAVRFAGIATDPDGDPLSYTWTQPVALNGPSTLTPSFVALAPGTLRFSLTASDGRGGVASSSVDVQVGAATGQPTDLLRLFGVVRLESGDFPPSGSRLQVRNARTGKLSESPVSADSGFYTLSFVDFTNSDAAAPGDRLEFFLFDAAGQARPILQPAGAALLLLEATVRQGSTQVDVLAAGSAAASGVLETLAGTGAAGSAGDTGPATSASLNGPVDVAVDGQDNVYVAEAGGARVRRFAPGGAIATVAGNGKLEPGGDSGSATGVAVGAPFGLALSGDGKLYISDRYNDRVREVDLARSTVRVLAGNGLETFGGDGGPAEQASFNQPRGLLLLAPAAGDHELLVADTGNHRVRGINLRTGLVRTVAGDGTPGTAISGTSLNGPAGLAFDSQGRLLVAELFGHRVSRINLTTGAIEKIAGTGLAGGLGDGDLAAKAQLFSPVRLAVRAGDEVLVAERDGNRIRAFTVSGNIRTLAGTGQRGFASDGVSALRAALGGPQGIATLTGGDVLFTDTANHRVRRIRVPSQRTGDDHPDRTADVGARDSVVAGGAPASGELERGDDVDFFRFDAAPGSSYDLRTLAGTLGDTVLTLFDRDGARVLAENDDADGARTSRIPAFRPSVAGTYFARVRAFQNTATGTYLLSVATQPLSTSPLLVTTGLPDATLDRSYGFTLEAAGGVAPYRFTLVAGSLPPGFASDFSEGLVSGTPAAVGSFRFAVLAKDANGLSAPIRTYALDVRPVAPDDFPESPHPYPASSAESKTFRLAGHPSGLVVSFDDRTAVEERFDFLHVLDGSGAPVAGSPFTGRALAGVTLQVPGDTLTVRLVSDGSVSGFGYRAVNVSAADPAVSTVALLVGPASLPGVRRGQNYQQQLTAVGGSEPLRWSVADPRALPPGIHLETASGVLSGVTTSTGEFGFDVKVLDAAGGAGLRHYTLPVFASGGSVLPESAHPYADGAEDVQSFTAERSPGSVLVAFDGQTELEAGFDFLYVTGADGTPATGSPFTGRALAGRILRVPGATVRLRLVSDSSGNRYGYRVASIVDAPVAVQPLAWVSLPALPSTSVGVSYSLVLQASGGVAPYRYSVIGGELPAGVFLDPFRGLLSGTAAQSGSFGFRLQVADSSAPPAVAERDFNLTVVQADPPEAAVTTQARGDTLLADVGLGTLREPLRRVTLLIGFDPVLLGAPRSNPGDAAPLAPAVTLLAAGLLRVESVGPPDVVRGGVLVRLEFDAQGGSSARPGLVTLLSSELAERSCGFARRQMRVPPRASERASLGRDAWRPQCPTPSRPSRTTCGPSCGSTADRAAIPTCRRYRSPIDGSNCEGRP
ncbi:MAG: DVUA0089 family protein, partial [Candidatus Wallbacteria bacterium]|nr:DVUA0089 family protein [Candidatus Wallbacteria bacterium]